MVASLVGVVVGRIYLRGWRAGHRRRVTRDVGREVLRKACLHWISQAVRPETRARRVLRTRSAGNEQILRISPRGMTWPCPAP
jgi:hypothetical protein